MAVGKIPALIYRKIMEGEDITPDEGKITKNIIGLDRTKGIR